ncbi:MAG: hypothetical protein L0216_03855 [Planctomycetales bacterium]|nr:hypothetical protein [Planctomycetales bacterium]
MADRSAILALLAVVAGTSLAAADTVHLANGGVIRDATVIERKGGTVLVEVRVGAGTIRAALDAAEVVRVESAAPAPAPEANGADGAALTDDPADPLARGFELLRAGALEAAEAAFRPLARAGPANAAARYGLACVAEARGDLEAADRESRFASILDPGHPGVALLRARLRHRAGDLRAAAAGYRRAIALAPDDARLRQEAQMGLVEAAAGRKLGDRGEAKAASEAEAKKRATFDAEAGNCLDAAEASAEIRGLKDLSLRETVLALKVEVEAPAPAVAAYRAGAPAEGFRETVGVVRGTLRVSPAFAKARAADREMLLLQVQSALAHRYPRSFASARALEGEAFRGEAVPASPMGKGGLHVLTRLDPPAPGGR